MRKIFVCNLFYAGAICSPLLLPLHPINSTSYSTHYTLSSRHRKNPPEMNEAHTECQLNSSYGQKSFDFIYIQFTVHQQI